MLHCGGGSFKSADEEGRCERRARLAVIIGEEEAAAGEAGVKTLREAREQQRVPVDALPDVIHELLYTETTEA